jgi:hypothetical protein
MLDAIDCEDRLRLIKLDEVLHKQRPRTRLVAGQWQDPSAPATSID